MPRPRVPASSPLRGRYLVRNRAWNAWLHINDWVLERVAGSSRAAAAPEAPRRVLIAVGGHLGDAVIATTVFREVADAFPGVEIGVLTGSWNRRVFDGHPQVRRIHERDHWKLSRDDRPLFARWLTTKRTEARALAEVRAAGYDVALDLAPYYPNSARLLWRAGVPMRVGYTSGGDGSLYTHPVAWRARGHVAEEHLSILAPLIPSLREARPGAYDLPVLSADVEARVIAHRRDVGLPAGDYAVVHVGAGHSRKEWSIDRWVKVTRELAALGVPAALTGSGMAQRALTARITSEAHTAADLCDRLDWNEFRALIAGARLVLSVDTVAMHVAAAHGVPCVALMTSMDEPRRWRPLGEATLLTAPVPCAPCYRSKGCSEMSCVRDITVASVVQAARAYLDGR